MGRKAKHKSVFQWTTLPLRGDWVLCDCCVLPSQYWEKWCRPLKVYNMDNTESHVRCFFFCLLTEPNYLWSCHVSLESGCCSNRICQFAHMWWIRGRVDFLRIMCSNSSDQRGLWMTGSEEEIQVKRMGMLRLSAGQRKERNVTSNCYLSSKTWSPIRKSKQAVFFGSRWCELRLWCVLKHHLCFWEHWHHIPISKGNPCGFLLVLTPAVPETFSQPLHLQHMPGAGYAPFDNLQCCALSVTPSFPLHHLAQICSAAEAFQIIHLMTKGSVTCHPRGNESLYHEGWGKKDICQQTLCVVEEEFKCRTPRRFTGA